MFLVIPLQYSLASLVTVSNGRRLTYVVLSRFLFGCHVRLSCLSPLLHYVPALLAVYEPGSMSDLVPCPLGNDRSSSVSFSTSPDSMSDIGSSDSSPGMSFNYLSSTNVLLVLVEAHNQAHNLIVTPSSGPTLPLHLAVQNRTARWRGRVGH